MLSSNVEKESIYLKLEEHGYILPEHSYEIETRFFIKKRVLGEYKFNTTFDIFNDSLFFTVMINENHVVYRKYINLEGSSLDKLLIDIDNNLLSFCFLVSFVNRQGINTHIKQTKFGKILEDFVTLNNYSIPLHFHLSFSEDFSTLKIYISYTTEERNLFVIDFRKQKNIEKLVDLIIEKSLGNKPSLFYEEIEGIV